MLSWQTAHERTVAMATRTADRNRTWFGATLGDDKRMDDLCIHELSPDQCSFCKGSASGPDPKAVAGGLKAAASRAGRVALPPHRFAEEVDAAVAHLKAAGDWVSVAAVQRVLRTAGYESGRRPTTAVMKARGLVE